MSPTRRAGIIIVPRAFTPNWDITIDGVNVDTELSQIETNRLVTEGTGNFNLTLLNPNAGFTFKGMEEMNVTADFGDGTTQFFKGTVEEVKRQLGDIPLIKLSGRHISGELADRLVTETYNNWEMSAVFKDIVEKYGISRDGTPYTVNNVNTTAVSDSISFDQTPFFDALRDVCYRSNSDSYCDDSLGFHFFESGSIENLVESIGPTWFISSEGLGDSIVEVKNRITVYGTTSSSLPIIHTADDTSSQGLYGIREKFINDSRINSIEIARMVAEAALLFNKNKNKIGTVNALGMPTLKPGDKIYIEEHNVGITGQYRISHINDRIGDDGWNTTVTAERIGSVRFSAIFKDLFKNSGTASFSNPSKMKYSMVDEFDNSTKIESSANITVTGGMIKQTALGSDGQIISTVYSASNDITSVELKIAGQDYTGSSFYVSTNGNAINPEWQAISPNIVSNISTPGKDMKIKIILTDNSTNPLPELFGYSLLMR